MGAISGACPIVWMGSGKGEPGVAPLGFPGGLSYLLASKRRSSGRFEAYCGPARSRRDTREPAKRPPLRGYGTGALLFGGDDVTARLSWRDLPATERIARLRE